MIPNQKTEKRRERKNCKQGNKHLLQGEERREAEELQSSEIYLSFYPNISDM